jgi:hypothetical protein
MIVYIMNEISGEMEVAGMNFPIEVRRLTDGWLAVNQRLLISAKNCTQRQALEDLKFATFEYLNNHGTELN